MTPTPASFVDRPIARCRRDGVAPEPTDASSERIDAAPPRPAAAPRRAQYDGTTAALDRPT